jgi:hypothetical protein
MGNIEKYNLKNHKHIVLFEKFFIKLKDENESDIINVVDFLKSPSIKTLNSETKQFNVELYYSFQFERILKKEQKYNKQIADLLLNTTNFKKELEDGESVILSIFDGFSLVDLTKDENLKKESSLMHHCVGNFGYYKKIVDGEIKIYSLRDRKNKPHVTFEYDISKGHIIQMQGKGNKPPEKYFKHIEELIKCGFKIPFKVLGRSNLFVLGKELVLGRKQYIEKLKIKYNKNDWESCIDGDIDCSEIEWFKIAPNVKLKSLNAKDSGLEFYPKNFSAEIVDQSGCKNAKTAPAIEMSMFTADDSALENYPDEFRSNYVSQKRCTNAKIAPNSKSICFYADNSGLETYPDRFKSDTVVQSGCHNAMTAPNCILSNFYAANSGLVNYPINFFSSFVNDNNCENIYTNYEHLKRNKMSIFIFKKVIKYKLYKKFPNFLSEL